MERHFGKIPEVPFKQAFLNYAKAQRRDHPKHFRDKTRYRLKGIFECFGRYNLSEITPHVIRQFYDARREVVSEGTAQKDLSTLRAILNRAKEDGLLAVAPHFPKMKSLKPRNRYLTIEEEDRLVSAAAPHLRPLIRFAVDTGGRRSSLLALDWRQVDLTNRLVTFVDTKNGSDHTVRLCDRACAVLASIGPKTQGLVFTYKGEPIKSVKTAFNYARVKAGLPDVRFHDLRHTFASRLVQGGVSIYKVMHMTGHRSLAMVQRYAHLAPDYQEEAIEVLNRAGHNLGTVSPNPKDGCRLSA
jgi:integrase